MLLAIPLLTFSQSPEIIKLEVGGVVNWKTNCNRTPETENNIYPVVSVTLKKGELPIVNEKVYLSSDGDILDAYDPNKTTQPCSRDLNGLLYFTTNQNGNAFITFDMLDALHKNKLPVDGKHFLIFTYYPNEPTKSIVQSTFLFSVCSGCMDCGIKFDNDAKLKNKVMIFPDFDFGGLPKEINTDIADLGDFNGKASSLKVYSDNWIIFYSKSDFSGSELRIKGPWEIKNLGGLCKKNCAVSTLPLPAGDWDDEINSIKIKPSDWVPNEDCSSMNCPNGPGYCGDCLESR